MSVQPSNLSNVTPIWPKLFKQACTLRNYIKATGRLYYSLIHCWNTWHILSVIYKNIILFSSVENILLLFSGYKPIFPIQSLRVIRIALLQSVYGTLETCTQTSRNYLWQNFNSTFCLQIYFCQKIAWRYVLNNCVHYLTSISHIIEKFAVTFLQKYCWQYNIKLHSVWK